MWYWLGSIGVIVLVALFALFYRDRSYPRQVQEAAPTTGISEEARPEGAQLDHEPGGTHPDPRFDSPDEEIRHRTR